MKLSKHGPVPIYSAIPRQGKDGATPTSPLGSPRDDTSKSNGGHGSPRSSPYSPTMPELRFVIVGSKASGKSTFIQRALDLKKPPVSLVSCKKMSLEGRVFLINLIELSLEDVEVSEDREIQWPDVPGNLDLSRVDGIVALYDVTRQESLSRIPNLLSK